MSLNDDSRRQKCRPRGRSICNRLKRNRRRQNLPWPPSLPLLWYRIPILFTSKQNNRRKRGCCSFLLFFTVHLFGKTTTCRRRGNLRPFPLSAGTLLIPIFSVLILTLLILPFLIVFLNFVLLLPTKPRSPLLFPLPNQCRAPNQFLNQHLHPRKLGVQA